MKLDLNLQIVSSRLEQKQVINEPYKALIAYLEEVSSNEVSFFLEPDNNLPKDLNSESLLEELSKLKQIFEEGVKNGDISAILSIEEDLGRLTAEIAKNSNQKKESLNTADQIWKKYEHIIEIAAISEKPQIGFSEEEKELFSKFVYRDMYIKHSEAKQNISNQDP